MKEGKEKMEGNKERQREKGKRKGRVEVSE